MTEHDPIREYDLNMTRRQLFGRGALGLGTAALANLMGPSALGATGGAMSGTHFPAKAKRVIYMFQSGGPSHIDLFDYSPRMQELHGTELPDDIRIASKVVARSMSVRFATISASPRATR